MSNILITGMTSSQASATSATLSFAATVRAQLIAEQHDVDWLEPDVEWSADFFDKYDAILVGMAPVTSIAANRAYGALNAINHLFDDPRLSFFIDAPNPELIRHSLRSIVKTPESLTKPFYKARKGYAVASTREVFARLLGTVKRLLDEEWPTTLYPELPWASPLLLGALQKSVTPDVLGVNFDFPLIKDTSVPPSSGRLFSTGWLIDNPKGRWSTATTVNLIRPVARMRFLNSWGDMDVAESMSKAAGVILAPQRNGVTWWSHRFAQALALGIPVVSEWRESRVLDGWNFLATEIEVMTPGERWTLAERQRISYAEAVKNPYQLEQALKLKGNINE